MLTRFLSITVAFLFATVALAQDYTARGFTSIPPVAGILAQCRDPWLAARAAVMAHALSGDELARERERGILALELAEGLSHWVNLKR